MTTETKNPNTVILDTPIERAGQTITEVTLRHPSTGELRGTTLNDLCNLDVDALSKVLPRISTPTLTASEVSKMNPADFVQLGATFSGFLAPKALLASMASQSE